MATRQLSLSSVEQRGLAVVRVTFTVFPRAVGPQGATDALNPANYSFAGPGVVSVVIVNRVSGDPASFDLLLNGQLTLGAWVVTVANVDTVFGEVLVAPVVLHLQVVDMSAPSVAEGAQDDSPEDVMQRHFNPAMSGRVWDALIAALAQGDKYNWENASSAFDQLNVCSASGRYLDRKTGDNGVRRPTGIGMSDELFRQLAILVTAEKLTEDVLLEVLEIFYGADACRAWMRTALCEPFNLHDGDDLDVLLDERISVPVVFRSGDFALQGSCKALEVALALTRAFKPLRLRAYAIPWTDPETSLTYVKVYSGTLGLSSAVRMTGGKAQNFLQFPDRIPAYTAPAALPTWNITTIPAEGKLRFTCTGTTGLDLTQVIVGDYVNIFGNEFQAANRGSYPVTKVSVTYPGGVKTQFFEIYNPDGTAQAGLTQAADASLYYFRPTKASIQRKGGGLAVLQTSRTVKVSLPATTQAVNREYLTAAYPFWNAPLTVSSLTRAQGGVVTVVAPGHGLAAGAMVEVDGATGSPTAPTPHAGDTVGPPLTTTASVASLWSVLKDASARKEHAVVRLKDGRALSFGGYGAAGYVSTGEMFAITAQTSFSDGAIQYLYEWETSGALPQPFGRTGAALMAAPILDGKVLAAGGYDGAARAQCYLFTPPAPLSSGGTWSGTGSLGIARYSHGLVVLSDNSVLVAGGETAMAVGTQTASCEIYSPTAATWSNTGSMLTPRASFPLVLLPDGSVLACGGLVGAAPTFRSERWSAGAWSATGGMAWSRYGHSALLLPDGRVLVVGGMGYPPSQPGAPVALLECEIWDPRTGIWSPAGRLAAARSNPTVYLLPTKNQVMVVGGGSASTELLDLRSMRWCRGPAIGAARDGAAGVVLNGVALLTGGSLAGVAQATPYLYVPAADRTYAGGLNGQFRVTNVIDANTFQYSTVGRQDYTANSSSLVSIRPISAQPGTILGPHTFDPDGNIGITGCETTIGQALAAGHSYADLAVADATQLPDQEGYLAFAFGTKLVMAPVHYFGRLSSTKLKLDFNFVFPHALPVGTKVCWIIGKGPWTPANVKALGALYITASNAGVAAARQVIDDVAAGGVAVETKIVYPGDRGLGGEGLPSTGNKVSDKVAVWGPDDIDAEMARVRL